MNRKLVAFFSASGVTTKLAKTLAKAIAADLYEIEPETPYTEADLNWMNRNSRSILEMRDPASRPAIVGKCSNMEEYDTIFLGFPVWCHTAPTIINTFLEGYDLTGKTIIPFATSGGTGMPRANEKLQPSCPKSTILNGKVFRSTASEAELAAWAEGLCK